MKITKEIFFATIHAIERQNVIDFVFQTTLSEAFDNKSIAMYDNSILVRQLLDLLRLEFPRDKDGICDIEEFVCYTNFGRAGEEEVVSVEYLWERLNDKKTLKFGKL